MSTIKTETLSTPSNATVPVDTVVNGTAKAWVNFNGSGTVAIRRAFNVASITDYGTGDYGVNFITAMPDANYANMGSVAGSSTDWAGTSYYTGNTANASQTAALLRFAIRDAYSANADTLRDHDCISVAIFS